MCANGAYLFVLSTLEVTDSWYRPLPPRKIDRLLFLITFLTQCFRTLSNKSAAFLKTELHITLYSKIYDRIYNTLYIHLPDLQPEVL